MKKTITLISILLSIHSFIYAQNTYFNNIYSYYNYHIAGLSIEKDGNNYVTASISSDTLLNRCIVFHRFDSLGNIIFKKSFEMSGYHVYPGHQGNLHKTSDGAFIISGAKVDTNGYISGFLLKTNYNFDSVFFKGFIDIDTNHHAEFQQCKETYDKGFILAGTKSSNVYNAFDQDILIVKTDSMGNEQWRRVINLGGVEYARNVIQTPDRGYLFGCATYNEYYLSGDGVIIKLDSLGNTKWTKTLFGPNQDGVPIVALAKDSNYIVATSYAYSTVFGGASNLKIQALKLNKNNGNTIWNKQYDTIRIAYYPSKVMVKDNGDIIITGGLDDNNNNIYFYRSFLLKLNSNGDSLFYNQYWYDSSQSAQNTIYDFTLDAQNNIFACGEVISYNIPQSLWLVKMDSLGCLQPGCDPTAGIEEPHYLKLGQPQIFPNPATTQTTITYMQLNKESQLQIYNMLGQLVYEEKLQKGSSQTLINTTGYKQGLYKVVVGESSGTLIIN